MMKRYKVGVFVVAAGIVMAVALVSCLRVSDGCEGINRPSSAPLVLRMKNPDLHACKVSTAGSGCTDVVCGSQLAGGGCACWQGRLGNATSGEQCTVSFKCANEVRDTPIFLNASCKFPSALNVTFVDASSPQYNENRYELTMEGGTCE
jgi:hypothetical protein